MGKDLSERTLEKLWELFPIFLVAHDDRWKDSFNEIGKELTVFLQRNGFSREPANYIKDNPKYLVKTEEGWRLHRSLLKCSNNDARTEAEIIDKNRPGLFINDEEEGTII